MKAASGSKRSETAPREESDQAKSLAVGSRNAIESKLDNFAERSVKVIALSGDTKEHTKFAKDKWKLDKLSVAHGLGLEQTRDQGLFFSESKGRASTGVEEPGLFSESAPYLVQPDRTLYFGSVRTHAFCQTAL